MIVPTCNVEILPIIELPPVFSVEIAVAGAKNGCFRTEMQGSAKEWWYGAPMLIKVRVECLRAWFEHGPWWWGRSGVSSPRFGGHPVQHHQPTIRIAWRH